MADSKTVTTSIRLDVDTREAAQSVLDELGISLSTAVSMFLRAVARNGRLPREVIDSRVMEEDADPAKVAAARKLIEAMGPEAARDYEEARAKRIARALDDVDDETYAAAIGAERKEKKTSGLSFSPDSVRSFLSQGAGGSQDGE